MKKSAEITRLCISEYINSNSGATLSEISDRLGYSEEIIKYHVRILVKSGVVSVIKKNKEKNRYYVSSSSIIMQSQFGINHLVNLFDRCVMSVRRGGAA